MTGAVRTSRPGLWGGLMIGTAAVILGLRSSGAINGPTAYILAIIPIVFMFVTARSLASARNPACGPAGDRGATPPA